MQCDFCSEPVTVRITEVRAGKPVDRKFCKRHAAEKLGVRGADEWEAFLGGLVAHFKQHGMLPTAAEISQQGEIGARVATLWHDGDGVFEDIRYAVQKRVAGY